MLRMMVLRAAATAVAMIGAAAYGSEAQLQTVIVTAERRSEPLQDVPAAVSALTGATLEAMGAESFTDYARSIPGLTFVDLGAGRQDHHIRALPGVGVYIGETPLGLGSTYAVNPTLIDIDRIEVLRGPQGTLYGSGSIGGTIRVIPNAPNLLRFEGSVKGEALVTQGADGASPGGQAELVLNVPIVQDTAAVRGAVWYRNVGGFINRTWTNAGTAGIATGLVQGKVGNLPDEHTWGMRTTALFHPTEQFDLSAMIYLERQHFDAFTDITGGDIPNGATNLNNDRLVQSLISDTAELQENRFTLYNITAKYRFGRFNAISSTSYSDSASITTEEGTSLISLIGGTPFPTVAGYYPHSAHQFTQEARLATSEPIARFDALIGVFYSKLNSPFNFFWSPSDYNKIVAGNDPTNPFYAINNNLFTINDGDISHGRHIAEFGELTYHLTDALSLTGGVRHYDDSSGTDYTQSTGTTIFLGPGPAPVVQDIHLAASTNGFVYKGNLSYKLTPDHLLYAQYSEGLRPGFGNKPLPSECNSQFVSQVSPDSTKNYELGAKTDWLQRRLTVNAAAYRINWSDIQQFKFLDCGFGIYANFGGAVIKGAELEVSGQLTPRLSAGLSGTYMHTELLAMTFGGHPGDPIQNVPSWQYSLYAQTTFPLLEMNDGFARVDYQYTGSSIADYSRLSDGSFNPAFEVQVVRLLNLRTGMRYHAWEFALSGTNLLNTIVRQSFDQSANVTAAIPGRLREVVTRSRTFSVSVAYQF